MATAPTPKIGVGVFVFNTKNEFLIGKRKGSHGSGTYALPGGHLEFGESFEECAIRETMEETGVRIWKPRFLTATNSVLGGPDLGSHYVTVFMVGRLRAEDVASVEVKEPEKCEGWEWIGWETMREWADGEGDEGRRVLFQPLVDLLEQRPEVVPRF
ncbi:Nudix hydrolase 1 [Cyphellophora attinorum]|uniref:Nudix hydrolase 1 n=1 Tax=Cyphellophora attinorum TaxID=1664694 RepID=A0A0N0NJH8_9EURO|nr:Nudix hydrolase 1 [Phialophora attinorum]KPI36918.1 Nudix hydrolase 1 [Phialophora attinorum]